MSQAPALPPPIPGYIRSYLQTAAAMAPAKRERDPESESGVAQTLASPAPRNEQLLSQLDEVMSAYRDMVEVLSTSSFLDSTVAIDDTQRNDDTELHTREDVQRAAAAWSATVAALQEAIRSKGAVCVKRQIRDRLREEISEKLCAVRKMESTVDTVRQMV